MSASRLDTFRVMVLRNPANLLARFGLANEAIKSGLHAEADEHLRVYLDSYEDEGNGYQRHAEVLTALGRTVEARAALTRGIDAAHRFGHPGMASELRDRLESLEGSV